LHLASGRSYIAPSSDRLYWPAMDELPPDTPDASEEEILSDEDLLALVKRLKAEHRAIDKEIKASAETGVMDMLKIRRMKKIKLAMKDRISFIENQITPDIIA